VLIELCCKESNCYFERLLQGILFPYPKIDDAVTHMPRVDALVSPQSRLHHRPVNLFHIKYVELSRAHLESWFFPLLANDHIPACELPALDSLLNLIDARKVDLLKVRE
jgi:hypothetical protein